MARSRSKAQALARLEEERALLEERVASLDPGSMLRPGVVGEWSVKDVLAHLADWEEHMLDWVASSRRGERVPGPEPGLSWNRLKDFNRRVFERHRDERLDQVVEYFRGAHGRFMELVAAMPEEEMLKRGRYPLTGKQAIYDWLLQYAAHDAWARRRIGEWLERGEGGAQAGSSGE
jgi:hypothetical protein